MYKIKDQLQFGQASIQIYDYSMARQVFFDLVDEALTENFCKLFDREKDSELFNLADGITDLKNKVQYLLQLK